MTSIEGVPDSIVQEAELRFKNGVKFHNGTIINGNDGIIKISKGEIKPSLSFKGALAVRVTESGSLFTIWREGKWATVIEEPKEEMYEIY